MFPRFSSWIAISSLFFVQFLSVNGSVYIEIKIGIKYEKHLFLFFLFSNNSYNEIITNNQYKKIETSII